MTTNPVPFQDWLANHADGILNFLQSDTRPTFFINYTLLTHAVFSSQIKSATPASGHIITGLEKIIAFKNAAFDTVATQEVLDDLYTSLTKSCKLNHGSREPVICTINGWAVRVTALATSSVEDYRIAVLEKQIDIASQYYRNPRDIQGSWTRKEGIISFFDVPASFQNFSIESGPEWKQSLIKQFDEDYHEFLVADWDKSPLGPLESWPQYLRILVSAVLTSTIATTLLWTKDFLSIPNREYSRLSQIRNRKVYGLPYATAWPEVSEMYCPLWTEALEKGHSVVKEAEFMFLTSPSGIMEECYFDITATPAVGISGKPEGVIVQVVDRSKETIMNRRNAALLSLSDVLSKYDDFTDEFWRSVLRQFDHMPADAPWITVYGRASNKDLFEQKGCLGADDVTVLAPMSFTLDQTTFKTSEWLFSKEIEKAASSRCPVVIENFHHLDAAKQNKGWRTFPEIPERVAILPIFASFGQCEGFLLFALNQRRAFEQSTLSWLEKLSREIRMNCERVTLLALERHRSVQSEQLRQQQLAQHQAWSTTHQQLADDLQLSLDCRTKELEESERLFTITAERIGVGLMLMKPEGEVIFVNDAWINMVGIPKENLVDLVWTNELPAYLDNIRDAFKEAVRTSSPMSLDFPIEHGTTKQRLWVNINMTVERHEDSKEVKWFMLTMSDFTSVKMAEEYEREVSRVADERRRQQENFVDMFSHELRNPFSAILQSSDMIHQVISEYRPEENNIDIDELMDASNTISVCISHQMRILDDVLILSKIDDVSFSIQPIEIQPHLLVNENLKIFRSEAERRNITLSYTVDESYSGFQWVLSDPTRWSQILVNLVSNAVKFTAIQTRQDKEIEITLAAMEDRPTSFQGVEFMKQENTTPRSKKNLDEGKTIFIIASVKDTGVGISDQSALFKKFGQAPKSYSNYAGGSGLGLYISRRLSHLLGGDIGFQSVEHKGSTFCFYIKAQTSPPPKVLKQSKDTRSNCADIPRRQVVISGKGAKPEPPSSPGLESHSKNSTTHSYDNSRDPMSRHKINRRTSNVGHVTRHPYRILVVEDNLINQEVLRRQLEKAGCVPRCVNNGQEALDVIDQSNFVVDDGLVTDIVLMDKEMPVLDGIEATKQIRERQRSGHIRRHVPILGISANARTEQVSEMKNAGMDDVITKPFRINQLLEKFPILYELNATIAADSKTLISSDGHGA